MKKLVSISALAILASLALGACGSSSSSSSTTASTTSTTTGAAAGGGASSTVKLSADSSNIAYTTTSLSAKAGNLTIDFTNPNSSLPHDVCVQSSSGQQLGCSDQVMGGSTSLNVQNLKPGSYTFYCSVDSHEQAGMKGTLSVK
ncbi:MAG TPA: plastocyanin/azurin family copper-binding protein [Solirubrobacterales bacterium]|nr:plastocyanin/azurin family copper-binding protein [Solirubrobacterales bacterium]